MANYRARDIQQTDMGAVSVVGGPGGTDGSGSEQTLKVAVDVNKLVAAIGRTLPTGANAAVRDYAANDTLEIMALPAGYYVANGFLRGTAASANVAGTVAVGTEGDEDKYLAVTPLRVGTNPAGLVAAAAASVSVDTDKTLRLTFKGTAAQLAGAEFVVVLPITNANPEYAMGGTGV